MLFLHNESFSKRPPGERLLKVNRAVSFRRPLPHLQSSSASTVLRERYLRDDVHCGISGCSICTPSSSFSASHDASDPSRLLPPSSANSVQHPLFPTGLFLIPDTNIFLHQMDLLESTFFNPPMIILQTVMEEVRHRSLPLHNRLKALVRTEEKRIWVFYNEYRR